MRAWKKPSGTTSQTAGSDFELELTNLYVSDAIANAILAARPQFADKPANVRILLQKQFPKVDDISTRRHDRKDPAGLRRQEGQSSPAC